MKLLFSIIILTFSYIGHDFFSDETVSGQQRIALIGSSLQITIIKSNLRILASGNNYESDFVRLKQLAKDSLFKCIKIIRVTQRLIVSNDSVENRVLKAKFFFDELLDKVQDAIDSVDRLNENSVPKKPVDVADSAMSFCEKAFDKSRAIAQLASMEILRGVE